MDEIDRLRFMLRTERRATSDLCEQIKRLAGQLDEMSARLACSEVENAKLRAMVIHLQGGDPRSVPEMVKAVHEQRSRRLGEPT